MCVTPIRTGPSGPPSTEQRYADLDEVLQMAAGADGELRQLWQTAEQQRRTGAGFVVDALIRKGPPKPGLDRESAIDLLRALTASGVFRRLVRQRGWTTQRYERWLADTFCEQLLPGPAKLP